MASTRKYDISKTNTGIFVNTFRRERPQLVSTGKNEDYERIAKKLVASVENALEQSTPKLEPQDRSRQGAVYRLPSKLRDLFIIARQLIDEDRRRVSRQNYQNYSRANYSKIDFFDKQLSFYVGDQCPNQLVNKKYAKPNEIDVDVEQIKELINKLPPNKLPGVDYIPNEVWQSILKCEEEYLINFISMILKALYFPAVFKQGKLIAFRKPHRRGYGPENYRFVTIATSFCKLYERLLVYQLRDQQLMDYLGRVNCQHGFTKNKSRFSALSAVVDEMRDIKRSGQFGVLISLDLKRAYDLISWDHIMQVAERNLDRKKCILISQLLKDRTIKLNEYERKIHRGLPQGSASSHLLWLIGTSDLMLALSSIMNVTPVAFVDDLMYVVLVGFVRICLIFKFEISNHLLLPYRFVLRGNSVDEVIGQAKSIKMTMEPWLRSAALQLNEDKCVYMQFSGRQRVYLNEFQIAGVRLRGVREIKYLGAHLNSSLNYESQLRDIGRRVRDTSRAIQAINHYREFSYNDRLQIYKRVLSPVLLDGWNIWANQVIRKRRFVDQLRQHQKRLLVALFNESEILKNSELCRKYQLFPIDLELQVKSEMKRLGDVLGRRLTAKEIKNIRLNVQQRNHFHF